ncbi:hypothetical protein FB476_3107 [Ornithinimicrobium humiphilum]|uniref:Uncharacterized protein n=1 Tax=Ornithinimicrobium humiphilum TaxID=125288 RepID=A0A543K6N3_9MICO|nr:hypothetical protein [Ornithinimicrobium humiphilum]TQM90725.1 hypothetical protein FB476_3107 [Ornithinimicrobium humiphilum]
MGEEQVDSADEALARAVDAVYAVEPTDFVATRKEWVTRLRSEGLREVAKEVAALRKPSVAAAAVNKLVRADDPVVERLRDVGARMRHAQSTLDAKALAALREDRDAVLTAWVAAAREHAGGSLTAAVESEVRDTAVAALADADATEVVTSGTLTRALSYSGFGEVDIADAVATTSTGVVLTRIEGGGADATEEDEEDEDLEEDEGVEEPGDDADDEPEDDGDDDLSELEMELDEAEKVVAAARAARRTAIQEEEKAAAQLQDARARLAEVEELLAAARAAVEEAEEDHERTSTALEDAEEELRRSRRHRDDARAALEEAEDR